LNNLAFSTAAHNQAYEAFGMTDTIGLIVFAVVLVIFFHRLQDATRMLK
jgi:hypothetical protein